MSFITSSAVKLETGIQAATSKAWRLRRLVDSVNHLNLLSGIPSAPSEHVFWQRNISIAGQGGWLNCHAAGWQLAYEPQFFKHKTFYLAAGLAATHNNCLLNQQAKAKIYTQFQPTSCFALQ